MSNTTGPAPQAAADRPPEEVVVISHSTLVYWWPVWAVGFLMAAVSYWQGYEVAFVPPGTAAQRQVRVEGQGTRDALVVPEGARLPDAPDSEEPLQPRMRMTVSNNPGILWALTLALVVLFTSVSLRGLWSVLLLVVMVSVAALLAALGLWAPIISGVRVIDFHLTALGYLSISLILFVLWLLVVFVYDRQVYLIFGRGQLRVRMAIGAGESVFDARGIMVEKQRDDLFRHWVLGFGAGDLTVRTGGSSPQYFHVPNVLFVGQKLKNISQTVKELQVVQVN